MMALRAHTRGGPEQLSYEPAPMPHPRSGEVLVAFATVPAAALAVKPRKVSHVEAASLPLAALTAWQALVDHAGLTCGETVLVHGGAGGVGVYAVQLAAGLGARVIATGAPPASDDAERYGVRATFFVVRPDHTELERLAHLVDVGRLQPVVSQTFLLAEGRRAYESGGQTRRPGKTVLVVRSSG
jgi:NADPH:quinone reductase-like Zn-dependent oxidoreductase